MFSYPFSVVKCENAAKTLVWTKNSLSVFKKQKTEVFENASVGTGPKARAQPLILIDSTGLLWRRKRERHETIGLRKQRHCTCVLKFGTFLRRTWPKNDVK